MAILLLYSFFACITAGSAISTGLVIPMLFIGSIYGRLFAYGLVQWFGVHGKKSLCFTHSHRLVVFFTCEAGVCLATLLTNIGVVSLIRLLLDIGINN